MEGDIGSGREWGRSCHENVILQNKDQLFKEKDSPESCFPLGTNISYSSPLSTKVATTVRKVRHITGQGQKPRNYVTDTLPPPQNTRSQSWKS